MFQNILLTQIHLIFIMAIKNNGEDKKNKKEKGKSKYFNRIWNYYSNIIRKKKNVYNDVVCMWKLCVIMLLWYFLYYVILIDSNYVIKSELT